MSTIIDIHDLTVTVRQEKILDDVSLCVPQGKIMGLVGGSGSGKTTLGRAILNLLPQAMQVAQGRIVYDSKDLLTLPSKHMRKIRGAKISMIFQEPLTAFDPLFTIGHQLDETLKAHTSLNRLARREKILTALKSVEIEDVKRIFESYPHELSGGLAQRAMIAQAIIGDPDLIIADEPTSNLDVTIQARIVALLKRLNQQHGLTILFITHDLGLVGYLAHDIAVMTQGRIVELNSAHTIMKNPQHMYTQELLKAY